VDIVDAALASMSGMTSQPCLNSLVAALRHTRRDSGLDQAALDRLSRYWSTVRELYYPFEEGLKAPAPDVYQHEMPGGQYTNLRQQARSLGLEGRWDEVCQAYVAANLLFGDIVKVTPSSKVVGDMALFMVANNLTADQLLASDAPLNYPQSVVEMMQGMLGRPEGGWPRPVQKKILGAGRAEPIAGRPGARLPKTDFGATAEELAAKIKRQPTDEEVLSYLLYPQVFLDFAEHTRLYGKTSVVPTASFFYGLQPGNEIAVEIEQGKTLIIRYLATGDPHEDGTRTVFFELNGHPREVSVSDLTRESSRKKQSVADPDDPNHIAAPMPGKISSVAVTKGRTVKAGDRLLSIEAMKMETALHADHDGRIAEVLVKAGDQIDAKDLLVRLG
jgi:pyruvate carboxylase